MDLLLYFSITLVLIVAVGIVCFASPDAPPSIWRHYDTYLEVFIKFVAARLSRQNDKRRFFREFGFKPWLFVRLLDGQREIIDAKLADAADALDRAFVAEEDFLRVDRSELATVRRLRDFQTETARAEKRFWYLHDFARSMAKYPECRVRSSGGWTISHSYTEHMTHPSRVHKAS